MDVNNTPYFLLRGAAEFEQGSSRLRWNSAVDALVLSQNQTLRLPVSNAAAAMSAWSTSTPLAIDIFNQVARLSDDRTHIEFNSGRGFVNLQDSEMTDVTTPVGTTFRDMSLGGDGRLACPYTDEVSQHGLRVFHLAHRWQTQCDLSRDAEDNPLAPPRRAWVDVQNQAWVVSATSLMLCAGEPLPLPYNPQPARFEPETENPHALQLQWVQALPTGWEALAICGDVEFVYVLVRDASDVQAIIRRPRIRRVDCALQLYKCEQGVPFVIDLAMAADSSYPVPERLAALAPKEAGDIAFVKRDAVILELHWNIAAGTGVARLVHERYPMLSLAVPRFVSSADDQLRYQADEDPDYPGFDPRPRELHALRRPQYYMEGSAMLHHIFDSGQPDTHWHRIYLDASIPLGCAIEISARVYSTPEQRGAIDPIAQPTPVWNPLSSELGFARSFAESSPGTSGLFEILLQRDAGPVRRMTGRYLQLHVTFRGDSRQTPCLHALRVYYPRFSYQEAYLPEIYHQELSVDPAVGLFPTGPANGPDVRERLLAAFESILTPVEGRIAASDQLVHPWATPKDNLPWISEMLGTPLPPHWSDARQRRLVSETTLVQQYKGTLYGVNLALDIVSDGGVQRGELVVVENFRLRRTMATILGINMDDADHPLTLGTGMSGNSIVGDSLILSESDAREFLALFSPDLATKKEAELVRQFFEQYAHQVTVLLHGRGTRIHNVVDEVLSAHMPAHVQWQIFETEHPFVLGLAPLLAVDTFIEVTPDFRRITLDDTYLGYEGVLKNPAAFSPADINTISA